MRPMWKINVPGFPFAKSKTHTHVHTLSPSRSPSLTNLLECVPKRRFLLFSSHFALLFFRLFYFAFCAPQIDFLTSGRENEWLNLLMLICKMRTDRIKIRIEIKSNDKFSCNGAGSGSNGIAKLRNYCFAETTQMEKRIEQKRPKQEHQQIWNNLTAVIVTAYLREEKNLHTTHTHTHTHITVAIKCVFIKYQSVVVHIACTPHSSVILRWFKFHLAK